MESSASNTLIELVRERRATSAFTSAPVSEADLQLIIRAGLESPSGYNLQPWRFVVVRDPSQRKRLRMAAMDQIQIEEAPVVIVACGDRDAWKKDLEEVIRIGMDHGSLDEDRIERRRTYVAEDLGSHPNMPMWLTRQTMIAATTMMWMAEALGYDTGPIEGFYEDQVREVLGIPDHVLVVFLLAMGHLRGEDGKYAGRLPATHTVFSDRYGEFMRVPSLEEAGSRRRIDA